jgi:uncharacterized PurR-regulated membrane protein YhhQ (DUF165 family)
MMMIPMSAAAATRVVVVALLAMIVLHHAIAVTMQFPEQHNLFTACRPVEWLYSYVSLASFMAYILASGGHSSQPAGHPESRSLSIV